MVKGLEQELKARLDGKKVRAMAENYPSPAVDADFLETAVSKVRIANQSTPNTMDRIEKEQLNQWQQQGADISIPFRFIGGWFQRLTRKAH